MVQTTTEISYVQFFNSDWYELRGVDKTLFCPKWTLLEKEGIGLPPLIPATVERSQLRAGVYYGCKQKRGMQLIIWPTAPERFTQLDTRPLDLVLVSRDRLNWEFFGSYHASIRPFGLADDRQGFIASCFDEGGSPHEVEWRDPEQF